MPEITPSRTNANAICE